MAVYVVPYRGDNFWGAFGQGMGGIVGQLLNTQLNATIDRGNQQRAVNQYKAFRDDVNGQLEAMGVDPLTATRQQYEQAERNSQYYSLLPDELRSRLDLSHANTEKTRGLEQQWEALRNTQGTDTANLVIGGQRAGTDASIQKELLDIDMPTYDASVIDQGDRTTTLFVNPRNPQDFYRRSYDKSLSPQDELNADLTREGLQTQKDVAKLQPRGIVSRLRGNGDSGLDLKYLLEQRKLIVEELQNGVIEVNSDVYNTRMADLAAIDARIAEYYGYTHLIPQPQPIVGTLTMSQINKEVKKLMDDERALGNDVSMEQALRIVRRKYGLE